MFFLIPLPAAIGAGLTYVVCHVAFKQCEAYGTSVMSHNNRAAVEVGGFELQCNLHIGTLLLPEQRAYTCARKRRKRD